MRRSFIVTYDISHPKRLRRVYELMRGYGNHIQLSVFECELSQTERCELAGKLGELIDHDEDQVLFIDLGLTDGRANEAISSLGRRHIAPEHIAIVA